MRTRESIKTPVGQGASQDNPTADDIGNVSEEVERLNREAGLLRNQLAYANRETKAVQSQLDAIGTCVTGWQKKCREQELLVHQLQQKLDQTLEEGREKSSESTEFLASKLENALQQLTAMSRERDDAADDTKRLKVHLENVGHERDQATQALERRDADYRQALLDGDARAASLKEAHDKEKVIQQIPSIYALTKIY